LTPERNEPCPCGSGKKYKRCCGLNQARQPDYFGINRAIAYKGVVGRARQGFCESYTSLKKSWLAEIENKLRQDLAIQDKVISCRRGCIHCCKFFVAASLQECECIVHYLYQHEEALRHFLQSFEDWKERVLKNERCFQKINNLHRKISEGNATEDERKFFSDACSEYVSADITCPFIKEGACTIYEVRPYVCAGVVATTPVEWCAPGHPRHAEASYYKTSVRSVTDMPYFVPLQTGGIDSSLPLMVYNILRGGYSALATIPGLEKLKNEALNDNEVRRILASLK
jgi:Fe-S-cluster containining protein